jgi:CheY-like chemotaxis protein
MVTRVVAAEDSYLIREGIRLLLDTQDDLELVAGVTNLPDLYAAVAEHEPDVVLTDVRMPPGDGDEGIRAAERLARTRPGLGVVVLSQYVEPEWALRLFDPVAAEGTGTPPAQLRLSLVAPVTGPPLDPEDVEAMLEHARSCGAHKVELEVWPDNARAIALYVSAGFEVEGLRRDHYRRRDGSLRSALLMARHLR